MKDLSNQSLLDSAVWLTWEVQVRNRSMAKALGVPIYEMVSNSPRFVKFPLFVLKTLLIVLRKKTRIIFAQNPSLVLSFLVTLVGLVTRKKIIIDAHNAGIYPLEGRYRLLNLIAKFVACNADLILVSNSYLAKIVDSWGGKSFVVPDPLPAIINEALAPEQKKEDFFFFICMWMDDEPYTEVIQSARLIPKDIKIYISGNFKKRLTSEYISSMPENIKLLGFVSEAEYVRYLSNAIAGIDLTTRDNCLVCGAYESIALGTPCVISESKINREIFSQGFIYTKNDALSISQALIQANSRRKELADQIAIKRHDHNHDIAEKIANLKRYLSMPASL